MFSLLLVLLFGLLLYIKDKIYGLGSSTLLHLKCLEPNFPQVKKSVAFFAFVFVVLIVAVVIVTLVGMTSPIWIVVINIVTIEILIAKTEMQCELIQCNLGTIGICYFI
jgi:hypothetical protein